MSNAMNMCLNPHCGHDLIYMTDDTTLYRVLSGEGLDPYAAASTASAMIEATGYRVDLDLANIDVAATQALFDAHDFNLERHSGYFTAGYPLT